MKAKKGHETSIRWGHRPTRCSITLSWQDTKCKWEEKEMIISLTLHFYSKPLFFLLQLADFTKGDEIKVMFYIVHHFKKEKQILMSVLCMANLIVFLLFTSWYMGSYKRSICMRMNTEQDLWSAHSTAREMLWTELPASTVVSITMHAKLDFSHLKKQKGFPFFE